VLNAFRHYSGRKSHRTIQNVRTSAPIGYVESNPSKAGRRPPRSGQRERFWVPCVGAFDHDAKCIRAGLDLVGKCLRPWRALGVTDVLQDNQERNCRFEVMFKAL
jgi:hypothetical protein